MAEYARERRLYPADPGDPGPRQGGLPVGRGQEFLQPSRRRRHRSWPRGHRQPAEFRLRPPPGRRLDDHPAGGQELPADHRPDLSTARSRRAILSFRIEQAYSQGPHPRALSQRDFLRPERLRRRRRRADLFRQVGERADHRRGRLSGVAAEGPVQLQSLPPCRCARSSAATGSSTRWSRMATSRARKARRPRPSRSASRRAAPAPICSPASISPRRCAARSSPATARMRSTKAVFRFAPRSIRSCSCIARKALQNGLMKYDTLRGYRGPVTHDRRVRRLGRAAGRGQGAGRRSRMDAGRRARQFGDRACPSACSPTRQASGELVEERVEGTVSQGRHELRHAPCRRRQDASRPSRRPTC